MCDCDHYDAPSCFSSKTRIAKKDHRCSECGRTIPRGASYEYASGVWDGEAASFKTCQRCVVLRAAHVAAEDAMDPRSVCTPILGELMATIADCTRGDPDYTAAFRAARRRLLAEAA